MPGRAMNGWVIVGPSTEWAPLVDDAAAFVASQ
jgi:hypothetical protein